MDTTMLIGLKRPLQEVFAQGEHPRPIKKAREDKTNIEVLTSDIFDVISQSLDFEHLMSLSMGSWKLKSSLHNMQMWKELRKEACVTPTKNESHYDCFRKAYEQELPVALLTAVRFFMESKNHGTQKNIDINLRDLYAIRCHKELLNSARSEITQRIKYLTAIYFVRGYPYAELNWHEAVSQLSPQALEGMSNVAQCYARCVTDGNPQDVYNSCQEICENESNPLWLRLEADCRRASMKVDNIIDRLTDAEAAKIFLYIHNHPHASLHAKATASIHLAQMHLEKRTDLITTDQAIRFLHKSIDSPHLSYRIQIAAGFKLALLRCSNRTESIDLKEAAILLKSCIKANISPPNQMIASYQLAMMRVRNYTKIITMEQAAVLLLAASTSLFLPEGMRLRAKTHLSMMKAMNLTNIIEDSEAALALKEALISSLLPPAEKVKCGACLALMMLGKRTDLIDDATAAKLLYNLSMAPSISPQLVSHAKFNLALMRAHKRTDIIDDVVAVQYLQEAATNPHLSQADHRTATVILAWFKFG